LSTSIRVMRLYADGQMSDQGKNLEELHIGDLRMKFSIQL
jgi:hypothetical protein